MGGDQRPAAQSAARAYLPSRLTTTGHERHWHQRRPRAAPAHPRARRRRASPASDGARGGQGDVVQHECKPRQYEIGGSTAGSMPRAGGTFVRPRRASGRASAQPGSGREPRRNRGLWDSGGLQAAPGPASGAAEALAAQILHRKHLRGKMGEATSMPFPSWHSTILADWARPAVLPINASHCPSGAGGNPPDVPPPGGK